MSLYTSKAFIVVFSLSIFIFEQTTVVLKNHYKLKKSDIGYSIAVNVYVGIKMHQSV